MQKNLSRFRFIYLTVILFSLGCGSPELKPIPHDGVILAFGDSLTVGVGVTKDKSYPSVLAELTGQTIINAGLSGETTTEGLKRLTDELNKHNPDLVILLEGGNDILNNHDLEQTKSNLANMISIARDQGAEVLLIGVPEKNLFSKVAPLYQELAKENNLVLVDNIVSELLRNSKYKSDPIHLNEAGYKVLAETIYASLLTHGAL